VPTILLHGTAMHHIICLEYNRGTTGFVLGVIESLRKLIPEAKFISLIQFSDSFSAKHNIKVVKNNLFSLKSFSLLESLKSSLLFLRCVLWVILRKYFSIKASILVNNRILKEYRQADVIIDLSADFFNDSYGIIPVIEYCRDILFGVLLGTPVVICSQSIGPFRGKLASWLTQFTLNRVSIITLREEISKDFLDEMGVSKTPIYVVADPAFLFEPSPEKRAKEILSKEGINSYTKTIIGIVNPEGELMMIGQSKGGYKSILISAYQFAQYCLPEELFLWLMKHIRKGKLYGTLQSQYKNKTIQIIAGIVGHIVKETDCSVLLVPHVVLPVRHGEEDQDARVTAKRIFQLVLNKERVIPITGDYTAQEVKGIIGQCNMIISLKLHAAIAATSQCVPTIAIGTHHKFRGIMRMLGQERWVFDQIPEDLITKIDEAWSKRGEITKELESRLVTLREDALRNARLIKQLLDYNLHSGDKSNDPKID